MNLYELSGTDKPASYLENDKAASYPGSDNPVSYDDCDDGDTGVRTIHRPQ